MHLKSSAGRPKGKCKGTVASNKKDNMAAEVSFTSSHVEKPVASGHTFCASSLYESKPRL